MNSCELCDLVLKEAGRCVSSAMGELHGLGYGISYIGYSFSLCLGFIFLFGRGRGFVVDWVEYLNETSVRFLIWEGLLFRYDAMCNLFALDGYLSAVS